MGWKGKNGACSTPKRSMPKKRWTVKMFMPTLIGSAFLLRLCLLFFSCCSSFSRSLSRALLAFRITFICLWACRCLCLPIILASMLLLFLALAWGWVTSSFGWFAPSPPSLSPLPPFCFWTHLFRISLLKFLLQVEVLSSCKSLLESMQTTKT